MCNVSPFFDLTVHLSGSTLFFTPICKPFDFFVSFSGSTAVTAAITASEAMICTAGSCIVAVYEITH